jgi:tryptophan 2,3-dioxygenase
MDKFNTSKAITYSNYLKVPELLNLQKPLSEGPEHDELLFIVIHQTYELWFKQLIHEFDHASYLLKIQDLYAALATLGRVRTIYKTLVAQIDILETMTPVQFSTFRSRLESASGFQSAQYREVEVILGRRDEKVISHLPQDDSITLRIRDRINQPSLWDITLKFLAERHFDIPKKVLTRNFSDLYQPDEEIEVILESVYHKFPEIALLLERLIDIDEGQQEWRYRHVKMVERTIGAKSGTGGSSGAKYLASTLFNPSFPELWQVRSRL